MDQLPRLMLSALCAMILSLTPALQCQAMDGPESVELDALAHFYDPVSFDHTMHVEAAEENCAACHHHTAGTPVTDENCARCHAESGATDEVACQECHPIKRFEAEHLNKLAKDNTIYHTDKVGLKAAYHLRCMGCHEEVGGPVGCQDCHQRNDAGDKLFYSGQYAPPPGKKKAGGHGGGHGGGSH